MLSRARVHFRVVCFGGVGPFYYRESAFQVVVLMIVCVCVPCCPSSFLSRFTSRAAKMHCFEFGFCVDFQNTSIYSEKSIKMKEANEISIDPMLDRSQKKPTHTGSFWGDFSTQNERGKSRINHNKKSSDYWIFLGLFFDSK